MTKSARGRSGDCPYNDLPASAFWSRSVAKPSGDVDPVIAAPFKISRDHKIATAGSCFAQHLARRLKTEGYNYLVTEPGFPRMGDPIAQRYGYGVFSARYGNIYTTRQLLQLIDRAYGRFQPAEPYWQNESYILDPFRPLIQPDGFQSTREAKLDREQHLAAVRALFETLDIFIFTLGLTETWRAKADGAVLPVCPGCGAGTFDADRYEFVNFEVAEVAADLHAFIERLREVNARAKIILTVSPVPLVATYSGNHVLSATTYSKSVLRVAADQVSRAFENAVYFPSYEIITGAFNQGRYFQDDLRNVTEDGVSHVMRTFFRHFAEDGGAPYTAPAPIAQKTKRAPSVLDAVCEEYASLGNAGRDEH